MQVLSSKMHRCISIEMVVLWSMSFTLSAVISIEIVPM